MGQEVMVTFCVRLVDSGRCRRRCRSGAACQLVDSSFHFAFLISHCPVCSNQPHPYFSILATPRGMAIPEDPKPGSNSNVNYKQVYRNLKRKLKILIQVKDH
jgi:hypothetical protein